CEPVKSLPAIVDGSTVRKQAQTLGRERGRFHVLLLVAFRERGPLSLPGASQRRPLSNSAGCNELWLRVLLLLIAEQEPKVEAGALTGPACHPQLPPADLGQPFRDGQPQSRPFDASTPAV